MATGGTPEDPFGLFSHTIITDLYEQDRFIEVMGQFYELMAEKNDCSITLSRRRFADAHDYWLEDVERMEGQSHPETTTLDHFKHGSIVAFWLRRLVPINDVYFASEYSSALAAGGRAKLEGARASDRQKAFSQYGSERCALYAGFYIILSYEAQRIEQDKDGASNLVVLTVDSARPSDLPDQFRHEYPMLMKTKNISAHSLYMMFCALFSDVAWRVPGAVHT